MTDRRRPRAARWPLALGVLAALALLVTALLEFGDPVRAAEAEVELGAAARADSVRSTWEALRAGSAAPAGEVVDVPLTPPAFARAAPGPHAPLEPSVEALLIAAERAANAGQTARAVTLADRAEARAAGAPSALGHVLLARARRAARVGDLRELDAVRNRAATAPSSRVRGTSAALLTALVAPADPRAATEALLGPEPALPAPMDTLAAGPDGLTFVGDPWWTVLEARVRAAAPEADASDLFHHRARRAEALRRLVGDEHGARADRWTFLERADHWLAVRRGSSGLWVAAVGQAQLAGALRAQLGSPDSRYRVHFDPDPTEAADEVRAREVLAGTSLGFTVHRDDPLRAGRIAAARLRAVRAGLVVLAVAILCATWFAARATRRAARLERLRSTFVASVSHDLRTPIQSILLMAETLERGRVAGESSQRRYHATIRQEADRLRRFVEDVLDGAKLDQGETAGVTRTEVETARLVESLERGLRERAERDGARLAFTASRLPDTLVLDADALHRIVWNLFENALRHGHLPGEPADVRVEIELAGDVLQLSVDDAGPGVPALFRETVFEAFERGAAEERGTNGTGLGLAIVRALARAHGGDAHLVPSAHGARFEASLTTAPSPSVA